MIVTKEMPPGETLTVVIKDLNEALLLLEEYDDTLFFNACNAASLAQSLVNFVFPYPDLVNIRDLYRHFKGDYYLVLNRGTMDATNASQYDDYSLTTYIPVKEIDTYYVRDTDEFSGPVPDNDDADELGRLMGRRFANVADFIKKQWEKLNREEEDEWQQSR